VGEIVAGWLDDHAVASPILASKAFSLQSALWCAILVLEVMLW